VYICYVDESGVVDPAGGTSHFVLVGLAIPAHRWREYDLAFSACKARHRLADREIHVGWMARRYPEQDRVAGFDRLPAADRVAAVLRERKIDIAKAALRGPAAVKSLAKNYKKSEPYVHLSYLERTAALEDLASTLGSWSDARLFGDAQDKRAKQRARKERANWTAGDHAFEQIVTRFHTFLTRDGDPASMGMLVYDHDQAVSTQLTERMRRFHVAGTQYAKIRNIVETPFFVDSSLTSMIQLADLAAYYTRRLCENAEEEMFRRFEPRFDRLNGLMVGLRHFTGNRRCTCIICTNHVRRGRGAGTY